MYSVIYYKKTLNDNWSIIPCLNVKQFYIFHSFVKKFKYIYIVQRCNDFKEIELRLNNALNNDVVL